MHKTRERMCMHAYVCTCSLQGTKRALNGDHPSKGTEAGSQFGKEISLFTV